MLKLLGFIWIGWGLVSGWAGLPFTFVVVEFEGPTPLVLMNYLACAVAWFVSGLAALQREMWGVYLGFVISWLSLLTNLFYLEPIGIFVSIGFILLSRPILKQYRQLNDPSVPSHDE